MGRRRKAKRGNAFSLSLAFATGCAPIAPPPLFARHHGAAPEPEGAVVVTLAAGIGGADLGGGFGLELRASWQATEALAVGVGIGGATGGDPPRDDEDAPLAPPTRLLALRGFGRATPPSATWVAATFGAGASVTNRGQWAATVDGGGLVSGEIAGTLEPSLGLAAALAVPLRQGSGILVDGEVKLPTTTLYLGGSLGLGVALGETDNVLSAELGAYRAMAAGGAAANVYALSIADAQAFGP
jgi:hypothetical protein